MTALFVIIPRNNSNNEIRYFSRTAQEFSEEIQVEMDTETESAYFNFKSFRDGDRITVNSSIDYIGHETDLDYTRIEFIVDTNIPSGGHISSIEFDINGDITNDFVIGDEIEISFTIKHTIFQYNNWTYDIEVYEEAWNKNFYLTHNFIQILPKSCIKLNSI